VKRQVTSVTVLDGNVYASISRDTIPLKYDSSKDQWSKLPALSVIGFSLVTVPDKKQLLAVGGVTSDGGVKMCKKYFSGMRHPRSGLILTQICPLHNFVAQPFAMDLQ